MSRRTLLTNITRLVCMDDARTELENGWVLVEGRQIVALGGGQVAPPPGADHVIDLQGHVVLPGMVNTHHHMYQSLTRVIPQAQDASLFGWLKTLYRSGGPYAGNGAGLHPHGHGGTAAFRLHHNQ